MTQSLDLFPIGNCAASGLIDRAGRLVWACAPRVDGDPMFSSLLGADPDAEPESHGHWGVEVEDLADVSQTYLRNTPILVTQMSDRSGASLQVIDFCPRTQRFERIGSRAPGSGLGLAIADSIASGARGQLVLRSPVPGRDDGFEAAFVPPAAAHA